MMWVNSHRPLLLLVSGLVLIAGAVGAIFLVTGNNDDGNNVGEVVKEKTPTQSRSGTAGGPDDVFRLKSNEATLNLDELPPGYEVDEPETFAMNITTFASSYWFRSNREGEEKAREWGIIGGFQVYYQPTGLFADVLRGSPYITIETYQFADQAGARKAFAHLNNVLKNNRSSDPVEALPLGNDSGAYRILQGTIGASEQVAVYHRFAFRRGNMVIAVQTWGADSYMNIDPARNIAAAIDDKLLGTRPAVEPTPLPTPSFGVAGGGN